ncbi:MAG: AsnC family transcriptional regulator [Desulfovibrio sp.]|nr:AsnC family transcriptional regulator [Desulfovibrio sp.]
MPDETDRRILDLIQSGFPLARRPYALIGAAVDIGEEEALQRVRDLKRRGIIRRIGANFDSARLGWRSTLCAAKVPEERLEDFTTRINLHPGVTHNYLRDHDYNVWFTLIAPTEENLAALLHNMEEETGISILSLPAARQYKIKVDFSWREPEEKNGGLPTHPCPGIQ